MEEPEDWSPSHPLPHGPSHSRRHSSDSGSDIGVPRPLQKDQREPPIQSLEDKAIELYVSNLLSRAHLILFKSFRADYDDSFYIFPVGKKVLEEAEVLCKPGRYILTDEVIAKCLYVRGFAADINFEHDNAAEKFEQAENHDIFYGTLTRPKWYKHQGQNFDELESFYGASSPVSRRRPIYRLGEPGSENELSRPTSQGSQESDLFEYLLEQSQRSPGEVNKVMRTLREGGDPRKNKAERKKSSPETLELFREAESSGGEDPIRVALHAEEDERKRHVRAKLDKVNAEARATAEAQGVATPPTDPSKVKAYHFGTPDTRSERMNALRSMSSSRRPSATSALDGTPSRKPSAVNTSDTGEASRRPSNHETVSSDTSIAEIDDGFKPANRSATAQASSPVSPTSPSPLRKAPSPGDMDA